jgi:hypothetical protein
MNQLLTFVGDLLYVAFSIITFPLFVVVHCLMATWTAMNYIGAHQKAFFKILHKQKEALHHFQLKRHLIFYRK